MKRIAAAVLLSVLTLAACSPASTTPTGLPAAYQVLNDRDVDVIELQSAPIYTPPEDIKAFARRYSDWMMGPNAPVRSFMGTPLGLADADRSRFEDAMKALAKEGHKPAMLLAEIMPSSSGGSSAQDILKNPVIQGLAKDGYVQALGLRAALSNDNSKPPSESDIKDMRAAAAQWPPLRGMLAHALMMQKDPTQREEGVRIAVATTSRASVSTLTYLARELVKLDPAPPVADTEARRILETVVAQVKPEDIAANNVSDSYSQAEAHLLLATLLEAGRGGTKDVARATKLYTETMQITGSDSYDESGKAAASALMRLGAPMPAPPPDPYATPAPYEAPMDAAAPADPAMPYPADPAPAPAPH